MTDARQADQSRRPDLIKESFGKSFWIFVGVAAGTATLCYIVLGPDSFTSVIARDRGLLAELLPRVAAAQILAGFVWVLPPRDRMSEFMQRNRGRRGLVLAAAADSLMNAVGYVLAFAVGTIFGMAALSFVRTVVDTLVESHDEPAGLD